MNTYVLYITDRGTPATGLAPAIVTWLRVSDAASAGNPPAIAEIGGGGYRFSAAPAVDIFAVVDAGAALADARDRYLPVRLGPYDGLAATLYAAAGLGYKAQTRIEVATAGAVRQVVFRGDTPTFSFTVTDVDGSVFDLTDYDVYLAAKASVDDDAAVFDKQCTVTDAVNGLCQVALTSADTAAAGVLLAEVELVGKAGSAAEGERFTVTRFTLEIVKDVRS